VSRSRDSQPTKRRSRLVASRPSRDSDERLRAARSARSSSFWVEPNRRSRVRKALLRWSKNEHRTFFWRESGVSPYALLVTEILLARTRAAAVEPVALNLLRSFPTPIELAEARTSDLERLLLPLGLYRKRAKHLIACARRIVDVFDAGVPPGADELMTLPYVGRYAANAVACFAFDTPRAVIDANVSRVYQRIFSIPKPVNRLSSAHALWDFGQKLLPRSGIDAKRFNWAILDLGGTICTPRAPGCSVCPVARLCDAHLRGTCGCRKAIDVKRSSDI
jgi:A/G-specific adenine glycosylase